MSRLSADLTGSSGFTWELNRVDDRYRCRCANHPSIEGWGSTEKEAIIDARGKMEVAVDKVEIPTASPHA